MIEGLEYIEVVKSFYSFLESRPLGVCCERITTASVIQCCIEDGSRSTCAV